MAIQLSKRIIRFVLLASLVFLSVVYVIGNVRFGDFYGTSLRQPSFGGNEKTNEEGDCSKFAGKKGFMGSDYARANATFVSLIKNSQIGEILPTVRMIEDRFNNKYHYPWVFLNDKPFTKESKRALCNLVSGKVEFGIIPKKQWSIPHWIDKKKAKAAWEKLKSAEVPYGGSESYRHMCRFESGFFWRHNLMEKYSWYWRVEPDTKILCDIDYDVFRWMEHNNKVYGFTLTMKEFVETIPTLWEATTDFIKEHPEYLAKDNMMDFVSDTGGETYNSCHFWSNFEIASLDFWRSDIYRKYFEYLDRKGGFFYERWGDAPVHSIAVSLFLPKDKVHHFSDFGYYHNPNLHCPLDTEVWRKGRCACNPEKDFTFHKYSCGKHYYTVNNLALPPGA